MKIKRHEMIIADFENTQKAQAAERGDDINEHAFIVDGVHFNPDIVGRHAYHYAICVAEVALFAQNVNGA
jgi:hypothetical protein